jgi:TolB-like protein/Flp pilus assembly protein TadD
VARLSHGNILEIHDFGREGDVTYAVTELLQGDTLRAELTRGPLPWKGARDIAAAAADGLAAAHSRDVVHRDLKPENIFITSDGRVKILDFGLAKLTGQTEAGPDGTALPTASLGTTPGTMLGTVGYMAPEQVRGEVADPRSDIFALGCVMFEMVGGRSPFRRDTPADTMSAILKEHPGDLAALGSAVPQELERIVARCLEKRPEQRFQSAQDLAFALRQLQSTGDVTKKSEPPSEERPSIAVLPFANLSADPEQEYFCDGMAEEIINALTRIEGLRVVARTSSFAFKGTAEDIREIGRELSVDKVLEGSVRKAGDRLRITAQLINVADGYHLWSERYDRQLEDVFAIQDEIATSVVDRLEVDLTGRKRAVMSRRYTDNLDAYNLYLKGLHHWGRLTPEGYRHSMECYQEAIRLDPDFAPAYVGMAIWHVSQSYWADLMSEDVVPQAIAYAEKALEIDTTLHDAHTVIGSAQAIVQWDWQAGERNMLRSIEMAPNVAWAHQNLGAMYLVTRRFEEAIVHVRTGMRLDPLSVTANAWGNAWLAHAGLYEEGVAALEELTATEPEQWMPHHQLSDVYMLLGDRVENAFVEAEKAYELSGGVTSTLTQLALLSYLTGRSNQGDELFDELLGRSPEAYVRPTFRARIHLARGEIDEGVRCAEQAVDEHDPWIVFHRFYQTVLPTDPRIDAMLDQVGV